MKINELAAVIFSMFIVKFLYDAPIDAVFILPIFFIGFYLLFKFAFFLATSSASWLISVAVTVEFWQ